MLDGFMERAWLRTRNNRNPAGGAALCTGRTITCRLGGDPTFDRSMMRGAPGTFRRGTPKMATSDERPLSTLLLPMAEMRKAYRVDADPGNAISVRLEEIGSRVSRANPCRDSSCQVVTRLFKVPARVVYGVLAGGSGVPPGLPGGSRCRSAL